MKDEVTEKLRDATLGLELFGCLLSMLRWYSNRLDGHNISPYENQPPEIQRAMNVYKTITGEDYK